MVQCGIPTMKASLWFGASRSKFTSLFLRRLVSGIKNSNATFCFFFILPAVDLLFYMYAPYLAKKKELAFSFGLVRKVVGSEFELFIILNILWIYLDCIARCQRRKCIHPKATELQLFSVVV